MTNRKDANRQKLFDAAIGLFSQHGYEAVSMGDIARAAGLSRASTFNHFPSKQDFLVQFFVEATGRIETGVRARPSADFPGFLSTLCDEIGKIADHNEVLLREISILSVPGEKIRNTEMDMDDSLSALFTEQVSRAQTQGEISAGHEASFISSLYMATLTGTAREWALGNADGDLASRLRRYFLLIFSGLKN